MTTAITMKVTLGALAGLISYCESKKMKMAKIKCHVANIAFIELSHPAFSYAKSLAGKADKCRSFAALALRIQSVITEINRVIDAAHAEALEMAEVVDLAVTKIKYGVDHYQAICNVRNETHRMITEKGYALGWGARSMVRLIANVWRLGDAAAKAHREAMAEMIARAPANGSIPGYEIPF